MIEELSEEDIVDQMYVTTESATNLYSSCERLVEDRNVTQTTLNRLNESINLVEGPEDSEISKGDGLANNDI